MNNLNEKLELLQYLQRKIKMQDREPGDTIADTRSGQGRILALLKMRDDISIKDISYLLGYAMSTLSELISKLEKKGYITREQSQADKRVTIIKLTPKGKEQKQEEVEQDDLFAILSQTEQETFEQCLDKLIQQLKQKLGFSDEQAIDEMNEAKIKMQELMQHFHNRHGRTHHDFKQHMDWHAKHGFFGKDDPRMHPHPPFPPHMHPHFAQPDPRDDQKDEPKDHPHFDILDPKMHRPSHPDKRTECPFPEQKESKPDKDKDKK